VGEQRVDESKVFSLDLVASDVDVGDSLRFSLDAGPAGATITPAGHLEWTAVDGPLAVDFTLRVTDQAGASGTRVVTLQVDNLPPQLTVSGASRVVVGQPYTLRLHYADPGADAVTTWIIDWGDGTSSSVAGTQSSASHVFVKPADSRLVTARAQDDDGLWTAAPLALRVLDEVHTPAQAPAHVAVPELERRPTASGVEREEPRRRESDWPQGLYDLGAMGLFNGDLTARVSGQSAHPFVQTMGFAVPDGAGTGQVLGAPLSAAQMAALQDLEPTLSGRSGSLQVRAVFVTAAGLRVRFNQAFDTRVLLAGDVSALITLLRNGVAIRGRAVADPDGEGFSFIAEGGMLPDGEYTVRLQSGARGFTKPNGDPLDGDSDGKAGADYRGHFKVEAGARRVGWSDDGRSLGLTLAQSFDVAVTLADAMEWTEQRWSVESDAPVDSGWAALTGGIGGVAMLAARPAASEHRMARRALAAGARRREAQEGESAIRINTTSAPAAPTHRAPAWVSRWLGQTKAADKEWRIRP
jgi:hypothetical protein